MRGRIITSDHRIFELPVLLRWNITYTGGVPCDSYEVTCVYDRTMAELLHLAAGFLALDENGGVLLRGIVDEYEVKLTAAGLTAVSYTHLFDIHVKGAGSDMVEKFFHTSDSAVLFPEFVSRVVRQGMEEESILPAITATVTRFDGMD